jgi:hypothetical protein
LEWSDFAIKEEIQMTDSMRLDAIHPFISDESILDRLLDTPLQNADLARIDGLRNEFEAEMVRQALDQEGIACLVQSNRETALAGVFIPQLAWGSLVVRMDQAEQALGVLNAVRQAYAQP